MAGEIDHRAVELLMAAASAIGGGFSMRRRDRLSVTVRSSVALKLSEEGWSEAAIGRVLGKNHATVHHMKERMRDMLSLPGQYPEAAEIWRTLNGKSDDTDERDI